MERGGEGRREGEGKGATLEAPRTARRASEGKLFIMPAPRQLPPNRFALSLEWPHPRESGPHARCVYACPSVHSREPVATHRGLSRPVRTAVGLGDGNEQGRRSLS